jgi:uncharacterized protein (DUF2062 family)
MQPQNPDTTSTPSAWLPKREQFVQHPWLKPWAPRLLDAKLWRFQHEAVARGVAVGFLWAFLIPFGQTVAAVVHCVWWRAHIPSAALMTMVTNPFTIGFWLWLAYQTGSAVLGESAPAPAGLADLSWDVLMAYGGPIVIGMALFAVGTAAAGYGLVKAGWLVRVAWLRRKRLAHSL